MYMYVLIYLEVLHIYVGMINCSHCYNCKSVIVLLGAINADSNDDEVCCVPLCIFWRFMILVVVKVTIINCDGEIADIVFTQLSHQRMNCLQNIINLKSHETN